MAHEHLASRRMPVRKTVATKIAIATDTCGKRLRNRGNALNQQVRIGSDNFGGGLSKYCGCEQRECGSKWLHWKNPILTSAARYWSTHKASTHRRGNLPAAARGASRIEFQLWPRRQQPARLWRTHGPLHEHGRRQFERPSDRIDADSRAQIRPTNKRFASLPNAPTRARSSSLINPENAQARVLNGLRHFGHARRNSRSDLTAAPTIRTNATAKNAPPRACT